MKSRCYNPARNCYENYGGRGITVCERWMRFENFLADMGPRPSPRHSIDRIDNEGNYEPGNCRWAVQKTQSRNTRSNRILTLNGKSQPVAAWAEELGVPTARLHSRLFRGWSVEETLTRPFRFRKLSPRDVQNIRAAYIAADGRKGIQTELSREYGVSVATVNTLVRAIRALKIPKQEM